MTHHQKLMIGHACLILIGALLAGFMLTIGLIGGLEIAPGFIVAAPYYGTTDGWVRAHAGGIANGLLILGVALAFPYAGLTRRKEALVAYGLIYVGWANTAFYWFGNAAGSRSLSFGDNPQGATNLLGMIGYAVAGVGSFLTLYILGMLALGFLRGDPE